ncbi:unnamed protein product [Ectocarpus fasciculatus]
MKRLDKSTGMAKSFNKRCTKPRFVHNVSQIAAKLATRLRRRLIEATQKCKILNVRRPPHVACCKTRIWLQHQLCQPAGPR